MKEQQDWDKFYQGRGNPVRWEGFKAAALVIVPVVLLGATAAWALIKMFG